MKPFLLAVAIVTTTTLCVTGCASGPSDVTSSVHANTQRSPSAKTMRAFSSDQELKAYFRELAEIRKREGGITRSFYGGLPAPALTKSAESAAGSMDAVKQESITNVQDAGVDEGGIVKVHGNQLVVLRRGRLFTVSIADGELEPISNIDAFGPDIDPRATWYDEMLVSDNTVAVIGYSYERGGTEVGLFRIDSEGKLNYRSTYHLRSNDYYSSRNYASRLIGNKLIFYSPLYFYPGYGDPWESFPAVRKWHKGARGSEFRRIVSANRIYRPEYPIHPTHGTALHTVTTCDLSHDDFDCQATSVIGPPGRVFYVSQNAVYVWVTDWVLRGKQRTEESMLYRMPLDGSSPSALQVSGSPVDQFSFLETAEGHLNVLVRTQGHGDGMWGAEAVTGDVALMTVPVDAFSDGSQAVPVSGYRNLPKPKGYTFQNRWIGDYLVYGTGSGWGYPRKADQTTLFAVRWTDGETSALPLEHGVDRIEQMNSDAVVVGNDGQDLHFTAVRLGDSPAVKGDYIRKGASQGELRSHGFFYKPDGKDSGMLGLPISVPGRAGYRHLFQNSAAILFLRNDALHFQEVGELSAQPETAKDDGCRASCVDWYGNARPVFVRGRVIALLGYELVEGSLGDGHMREMRRVSYAPQNVSASNGDGGELP